MQKTNSRKIRSNAIANLSKRSIGVLAMQSVPGGLLPLMAKYTVFSKPSTGQPVSGPNPVVARLGTASVSRSLTGQQRSFSAEWPVTSGLA
jgi:hypothetical protein